MPITIQESSSPLPVFLRDSKKRDGTLNGNKISIRHDDIINIATSKTAGEAVDKSVNGFADTVVSLFSDAKQKTIHDLYNYAADDDVDLSDELKVLNRILKIDHLV